MDFPHKPPNVQMFGRSTKAPVTSFCRSRRLRHHDHRYLSAHAGAGAGRLLQDLASDDVHGLPVPFFFKLSVW